MWWIWLTSALAADPWPMGGGNPQRTFSSPIGNWSHPLVTMVKVDGGPPNQPYSYPDNFLVLETKIIMLYQYNSTAVNPYKIGAKPFVSPVWNPDPEWEVILPYNVNNSLWDIGVSNGFVYVLLSNWTGVTLYQYTIDGGLGFVASFLPVYGNPQCLLILDTNRVYVAVQGQEIRAFSHDGAQEWSAPISYAIGPTLALSWDLTTLFLSSWDYANCSLLAFNAATGRQTWQSYLGANLPACTGPAVRPNGDLVMITDCLVVISVAGGEAKKSCKFGAYTRDDFFAVGYDNSVYVADYAVSQILMFTPDLTLKWSASAHDYIKELVVTGDGSVFVMTQDNGVLMFTSAGEAKGTSWPITVWYWMVGIGPNNGPLFYIDDVGTISALQPVCAHDSESPLQACLCSGEASLDNGCGVPSLQQWWFWVVIGAAGLLSVVLVARAYTYLSLRKRGVLNHDLSPCSMCLAVMFCGCCGSPTAVEQLETPLITEPDPYPIVMKRTEEALSELCKSFHATGPPDATLRELKSISKRGAPLISSLFEHELASVPGLFGAFADGRRSEYDLLKGCSQPMLHPSFACLLELGNKVQPQFVENMKIVCEKANLALCDLKIGPVKGEFRLLEKMNELEESKKDRYAVFDMNRATLLCVTPEKVLAVILALGEVFVMKKLKNKFDVAPNQIKEPPCLFLQMGMKYSELDSFLLPGSHWVVELQITTPGIRSVKEYAHKFYEIDRAEKLPSKCVVCG